MAEPSVRVRGMYATAITNRCQSAGFEVVDPSETLEQRFEEPFPSSAPDVTIRDVPDRSGVELSGDPTSVAAVAEELAETSRDSIRVDAEMARGAMFLGEIVDKRERGAIVDTGPRTGFLPYGQADEFVEEGDSVFVQVSDPHPPWLRRRQPVLTQELRIPGVYVSLVSDASGTIVSSPSESLAVTVERLGPDVPASWGMAIHACAENAELSSIRSEIEDLASYAPEVESAIEADAAAAPGHLLDLQASVWCRFGREGRFALDEARGEVAPTIEGHHRIKSTGRCGGTAVDLMEGYGHDEAAFNPDALFDAFGPDPGDCVSIEHGKPSGEAITLGRAEVIERSEGGSIRVERTLSGHGMYDAIGVPKEEGDVAETTFVEGRWWYPTVYRSSEGTYKGTYVNIGTPIEIYPDRVRYVDLFVDVVKTPDGSVNIVDQHELDVNVEAGFVPAALATHVASVAEAIVQAF